MGSPRLKLPIISAVLAGLLMCAAIGLAAAQREVYTWPSDPVVATSGALVDRQVLRLYTGASPGAAEVGEARSSLATPGMEVFLPKADVSTGKTIILVPGGSYHHITASKLFTVADALRAQGATVFVLFYRYGTSNPCPAPLEDGLRAVRIVRAHAADWKLDPKLVTMIGCSAGGHLAGWTAVRGDAGNPKSADPIERVSSRPDRLALISPVISMREDWSGTRANTLPKGADAAEFGKQYSIDLLVDKNAPPTFLWHALDDNAVKAAANSERLADALTKAGVRNKYIKADKGGHVGAWSATWGDPLVEWLRGEGVLRAKP